MDVLVGCDECNCADSGSENAEEPSQENEGSDDTTGETEEECEDTSACAALRSVDFTFSCENVQHQIACPKFCNACDVIDNITGGGDGSVTDMCAVCCAMDRPVGCDDCTCDNSSDDTTGETEDQCVDTAACATMRSTLGAAFNCENASHKIACPLFCNACDESVIDNIPGGGDDNPLIPTGLPDTCGVCCASPMDIPVGCDECNCAGSGSDNEEEPSQEGEGSSEEECEDMTGCALLRSMDPTFSCENAHHQIVCPKFCNVCDDTIIDQITGGGNNPLIPTGLPDTCGVCCTMDVPIGCDECNCANSGSDNTENSSQEDEESHVDTNEENSSQEDEESSEPTTPQESTPTEAPSQEVKFGMKLSMTREQFETKKSDVKKSIADTLEVDEDSIEVNAKERRSLRRRLDGEVEIEVTVRGDEDTTKSVVETVKADSFTDELTENLNDNITDIEIEVSDVTTPKATTITEDVKDNLGSDKNKVESASDDGGMDTMVIVMIALGAVVLCLLFAAGYYAFTGSKMESEVIDMGDRMDAENPAIVGGAAFETEKRNQQSAEGVMAFETGTRP